MSPVVTALIPAYNEERKIGQTLEALAATGRIDEIIVVDDGSEDMTAAVAAAAGAKVTRLPENRGKGDALRRGVATAGGDIILLVDGDLGVSAKETVRLLDALAEDRADMVIATVPHTLGKGGFGLAAGTARLCIRLLTGLKLRAPLSGQRAVRRHILQRLDFAPGFGVEVALTIDAARAGFRILEVETDIAHAGTGRTLAGFGHRGRQLWHIIRAVLPRTVRRRRDKAARMVEGH